MYINVQPYWSIDGRTGVISRILEELDSTGYKNNFEVNDVQLIYNFKIMDYNSLLVHYPGLTRKYIQFTKFSGIVKHFYESITTNPYNVGTEFLPRHIDSGNPYGYITGIPVPTSTLKDKMLILELKGNNNREIYNVNDERDEHNDREKSNEFNECNNGDEHNDREKCKQREKFNDKCIMCKKGSSCMFSQCGHSFCLDCGQSWSNKHCPSCNKTIF
jgi:uncharacterized protein YihD (DUF1040 family)